MIGRSLTSRLALLQQLIAVVVILVFAASSLWITQRTLEREEHAILLETARRLADNVDREYREEHDLATAASDVLEEEAAFGMWIDIVDSAGHQLASSRRAVADRTSVSDQTDDNHIQKVSISSASGAIIRVSVSSRLRDASVAALARALLISAVPLLILTLLLIRAITRRAIRPLARMERRAHEAAAEQGVRSIGPASGLAEIDALRDSFDRLLCRLDDLLQSERRFTSDASHELRTPLTVLSGELETALVRTDLPPEARGGLKRAAEQAQTMRDLVEALLLLRRAGPFTVKERGAFEIVNLADVVREITQEALMRNAARSEDLEVSAPDEVLVSGQPALLASAVRNIVDNAIKFTRAGQAIRITVEGADQVSIIVNDGGPGIPPEERERVFDPFYRGAEARAARSGLGLGLPILRQVARAHGGEVTIGDSALGGACVILRLPAWEAARYPDRIDGGVRN
jgi:signal transduction histidine kinase